jgi:hypothetical protein
MKVLNEDVKGGWKHYLSPTPKNFRRAGDAMLAISAIGVVLVPGAKWVAVVGIAGKFITNFFTNK